MAVRAERRRRIADDLRKNAEGRATLLVTWRTNGGGPARTIFVAAFTVGIVLAMVYLASTPGR
ncbi:hypothetical protein [Luedemannella flava]|uniref:hypothetical protein n=1 Tax=Luedemannella flava TaxID=349316 RepID=UPI0031DD9761